VLVLAHRGYHRSRPENTLAAFEAAVAQGVDGIETDLRVSLDDRLILFHDACLADGTPVAELTRGQLARAAGHAVATLEEAFACWPDLLWNVELKTPDALGPLAQRFARGGLPPRVLFTAFDHAAVVDALAYLDADGGLLLEAPPPDLDALLEAHRRKPRLRTLVWRHGDATADSVARARAAGWRSFVYGAITPEEHRRATALGIDGIITDEPELAGR
jgi:glycerophosphoryl diester phosphodiesterase